MTSPYAAAAYWYYDGAMIYYRMIVDGDPVKNRGTATAQMHPFGWNVLIESTGDSYPDYSVSVDGTGSSNKFHTMYNTGLDIDMDAETGYSVTASNPPFTDADGYQILLNGYVRSRQVTTDPLKYYNGNPDFYIDFMVPLSWLSRSGGQTPPPPITASTPIKFAYGTGTSGNTINKDLEGQSDTTNITDLLNTTPPTSIGSGGYGTLRDTRHADSPSNMGIWQAGETVLVYGYGWPSSGAACNRSYLNVRIMDPLNQQVWSGTVPCSTTGTVTNGSTITIGASFAVGVYTILVEDPLSLGTYNSRDTFTVTANGAILTSSVKTVDKASAVAGDELLYTITVKNTGSSTANGIVVRDILSPYVGYISGSTTAAGLSIADVAGGSPLFGGYSVPPLGPGASYVFTLKARLLASAPDQAQIVNSASLSYGGVTYVLEALTIANAPVMVITKSITPSSPVMRGETVDYSISFTNVGHSNANNVEIIDIIPQQVVYVPGSAASTIGGGAFGYRYIPAGPFEPSDALGSPVIEIRYILGTLAPGATGMITFRAVVK